MRHSTFFYNTGTNIPPLFELITQLTDIPHEVIAAYFFALENNESVKNALMYGMAQFQCARQQCLAILRQYIQAGIESPAEENLAMLRIVSDETIEPSERIKRLGAKLACFTRLGIHVVEDNGSIKEQIWREALCQNVTITHFEMYDSAFSRSLQQRIIQGPTLVLDINGVADADILRQVLKMPYLWRLRLQDCKITNRYFYADLSRWLLVCGRLGKLDIGWTHFGEISVPNFDEQFFNLAQDSDIQNFATAVNGNGNFKQLSVSFGNNDNSKRFAAVLLEELAYNSSLQRIFLQVDKLDDRLLNSLTHFLQGNNKVAEMHLTVSADPVQLSDAAQDEFCQMLMWRTDFKFSIDIGPNPTSMFDFLRRLQSIVHQDGGVEMDVDAERAVANWQ
jgi:hypothetical protein